MEEDMKNAENRPNGPQNPAVRNDKHSVADGADRRIPAENMARENDEHDDIIKDEYAGNLSYEALKSREQTFQVLEEEEDFTERMVAAAQTGLEIIRMKLEKTFLGRYVDSLQMKTIIIIIAVILLVVSALVFGRNKGKDTTVGKSQSQLGEFADVKNMNDALRMKNLTTLANIAVVYHIEQKADFPISKDYVKLNESNPVADYMKDAAFRYGKPESLLLDPINPAGSYFAYRSEDGLNIEFTARMDSLESAYCSSYPCIYSKIVAKGDIENIGKNIDKYK